ncbi:MAG: riboflavin synthase [Arthrobacter sp.]|uniref:riboflavin synthase n=1 Tax=unclassified Arthrobacter TaxID=235627 RepID=UPI0026570A1E|nr:riboflavin synthase [Micrococcaceae bacterium]MDN5811604.1 riboflavin synthase [Micrococcaceae bacterium]MDN5824626.1 riboflavin synthase [Micrococcaceae bacterium]MDN5878788.1 riboflavin synthase [Micrococcaceae bacterium]MDN5886536.1 riboflavin synthase [Micrococcaceae bacterium]
MFTGIITGLGNVEEISAVPGQDAAILRINAPGHASDLGLGGSLAVNGVCLTATAITGDAVDLDVMGESLRLTTTGTLAVGEQVNLERCVPAGGRLDGHVVQGHVDGTGTVLEREDEGNWVRLRFGLDRELARYVARKGSIAVDGVSLTVTTVSEAAEAEQYFEVGVIPTTLRETVLGQRQPGDTVNLEVDVMAKYAERLAAFSEGARR